MNNQSNPADGEPAEVSNQPAAPAIATHAAGSGNGKSELLKLLAWLSNKYRREHDARRKYETQYTLGGITVLLVATGGLVLKEVKLPDASGWVFYVPGLCFALLLSLLLWSIHFSNQRDKFRAQAAEDAIVREVNSRLEKITAPIPIFKSDNRWQKLVAAAKRWMNFGVQVACLFGAAWFFGYVGKQVAHTKAAVPPDTACHCGHDCQQPPTTDW